MNICQLILPRPKLPKLLLYFYTLSVYQQMFHLFLLAFQNKFSKNIREKTATEGV